MRKQYRDVISAWVCRVAILAFMVVISVACTKDKTPERKEMVFEIEEFATPTADALTVTSNLPAYIFPYEYTDFGAALVRRLTNRVTIVDEQSLETLSTVVIHSSQITTMSDELPVVLMQLMLGRNIVIIEPTIQSFNDFCDLITATYMVMQQTEEGQQLLEEIDAVEGVRQTFEAFYEMSMDNSKIEAMFMLDTDYKGVFAEALAVRGCEFHIVDRMRGVENTAMFHQQIVDDEGAYEPSDAPQIDAPEQDTAQSSITPYAYGLFADMFTKWINEQIYYIDDLNVVRKRGAEIFNTRAESTTKLNLDDISTVQNVTYTISASIPYKVAAPLPVSVSFEVCSIYMERDNSDYYCIYKQILSYNQLLNCGPTGKRSWRHSPNFCYRTLDFYGDIIYKQYPYYGPFMRDLKSESICHAHTADFIDSTDTAVEMPDVEQVERLAGVVVEKYSPLNSIGSSDKTSGFSYGFDGGLYISKEPALNLGFSVSYDSSTTQTIDDLEIEASSIDGVAEWKYTGHNLPRSYYNFIKENSHSFAPSIMRQECLVDQSWIWRVPNPTGSYRLFDKTSVTTALMYYDLGFLKTHCHYANLTTAKCVSFMMMPPPRSEQKWVMNVTPYSEELNTMLSTTHNRFWNKDNHEFELADTSADSRITISQFVSDFEKDLISKRLSWRNRNFKGTYTFSYYNVSEKPQDVISFDFMVD